MSFRPTYELRLGNYRLSNKVNNRLIELSVETDLNVPVNVCQITLPKIGDMRLETGMSVVVQLGYDGQNTKVFTGELHQLDYGIETISIRAMSGFYRLNSMHGNLFYEKPTALAITLDLCQQAGIVPGRVETGLNFSFYALGSERSYYDHLSDLASQCGYDLYADTNDQLVFGKPIPFQVFPYEEGVNILKMYLSEKSSELSKVEVYGESPASLGQGIQRASWLTKKEVKGSAGTGQGGVRRVFSPTIRSLDNASRMAQALEQQWKKGKEGLLKGLGAAEVQVGDKLNVTSTLTKTLPELFKVTGIFHQLKASTGFISQFKIKA